MTEIMATEFPIKLIWRGPAPGLILTVVTCTKEPANITEASL